MGINPVSLDRPPRKDGQDAPEDYGECHALKYRGLAKGRPYVRDEDDEYYPGDDGVEVVPLAWGAERTDRHDQHSDQHCGDVSVLTLTRVS
jgi:hypothetical protein